MHDNIKSFTLFGEISDADVVKTKARLVESLEGTLRDEGYAPDLDKEPQFTLDFIPEASKYNFVLTVYGVYVGKDKSWSTGGVMGGKIILKSTQPIK
jgi:hypothetical protein